MSPVRVMIVDDSALVRRLLSEILSSDPDIEVVGAAMDPLLAREKIKKLNPDVLTLDVEMPRMDGLSFLENLMRLRPMPVVMVSSLTEKGADVTLRALELGAIDFVAKPKIDVAAGLKEYGEEIIEKVKAAAKARVRPLERSRSVPRQTSVSEKQSTDAVLARAAGARHFRTTDKLIAIGASTGGTEAIREVLAGLPSDAPGIVIVQHIPGSFSGPFAKRMDESCALRVFEASDGQEIRAGHVFIAPGTRHLLVERSGARFICRLHDGPPVNRHKPSVDVLFRSVANNVGHNAIGVLLTGMGDDGAHGLKEMKDLGSVTIAQDEATSVVWGMPGVAVKLDAVSGVLPVDRIAGKLLSVAAQ